MKRTLILLASVAVVAASCNKTEVQRQIPQGDPVTCSFSSASGVLDVTKSTGIESDATGTADEKTVNSLQIYIFDGSGLLVASDYAEANKIDMVVNSGSGYTIYAVTNCPNWVQSVKTVADLTAKSADNLGNENGNVNFAMQGILENQTVSKESNQFVVPVKRRASKVIVRKVTNGLSTGDLKILGIYLSNVTTVSNMFDTELPSDPAWVNKQGVFDLLSSMSRFGDKFQTAVTVSNGQAYSTAHSFYAAANAVETDVHTSATEGQFSPRFTRLVIKAEINGVAYYYPLSFGTETLPAIGANQLFDITNLTIKHLGSDDPEHDIETAAIAISVNVQDWDRSEYSFEF